MKMFPMWCLPHGLGDRRGYCQGCVILAVGPPHLPVLLPALLIPCVGQWVVPVGSVRQLVVPQDLKTWLIILAVINVVLQILPPEKAVTPDSLSSFAVLSSAFRMYVQFCTPIQQR